jgi:hypothetical protein
LSSNHEIPFVDVLRGGSAPYGGFGNVIDDSTQRERELHEDASEASQRLRDTFGLTLTDPSKIAEELDSIVREMWRTGWNPKLGSVDLFARDFGLVLVEAILNLLGGKLTMRSGDNASHWSIFWPYAKIEAFPFHKTIKCVLDDDGDTMAYFVKGLGHLISDNAKTLGPAESASLELSKRDS